LRKSFRRQPFEQNHRRQRFLKLLHWIRDGNNSLTRLPILTYFLRTSQDMDSAAVKDYIAP
jgi:hypothetical protein